MHVYGCKTFLLLTGAVGATAEVHADHHNQDACESPAGPCQTGTASTRHHSADNKKTCDAAAVQTKAHAGGDNKDGSANSPDNSTREPSASNDEYDDVTWETLKNTNVTFKDILGCTAAIEIIKEAVVIPMKFPTLFKKMNAKRSNGMILYGPPGTGKTMIARATASEVQACFFNASCAELTSRWVGGSEKKLKSLFKAALQNAPAVIFFDEIDSIASKREGDTSIADQRLTNQFLIELDNIYTSQAQVFVIAATNLPWQIDLAVMRRFPSAVYIPLPDSVCRRQMFSTLLHNIVGVYTDQQYDHLCSVSMNMSGSDISNVVNSIRFQPLRRLYQCSAFTFSRDAQNEIKISVTAPPPQPLKGPLGGGPLWAGPFRVPTAPSRGCAGGTRNDFFQEVGGVEAADVDSQTADAPAIGALCCPGQQCKPVDSHAVHAHSDLDRRTHSIRGTAASTAPETDGGSRACYDDSHPHTIQIAAGDPAKDSCAMDGIQHYSTDALSVSSAHTGMSSVLHMDLTEVIDTYGEDCIVIPTVQFDCILAAVTIAPPTATQEYIQRYENYNSSRKN